MSAFQPRPIDPAAGARLADELGVPTVGTSLVFQMYRALQAQGLGSEGNHALVKALEDMSGTRLGDDG